MSRRLEPSVNEIFAQLPAAIERGKREPVAERVIYDQDSGYFLVECRLAFRPAHVKGLENATTRQLMNCVLLGGGESIYWPELDEGVSVATLVSG